MSSSGVFAVRSRDRAPGAMPFLLTAVLLVVLAMFALATSAHGADWPVWRGPQRNGHTPEVSGWGDGSWLGEAAWTVNVGEGSTSPVVVGDAIYTMGSADGQDSVLRLELATGKTVWTRTYPSPKFGRKATGDQRLYAGICSTPEYDPATRLLYTLGIDGDLHCWDTSKQGEPVWSLNLYDKYDPPQRPQVGRSGLRDYGFTSSPLVQGDWLLVEVGSRTGTVVAFDKRTGEERWRSENTDPPGHAGGPVPITVDDVPCLAVHTFEGLLVLRLDADNAGTTVATTPWRTEYANGIPTPTVHGQSVLLTSAYNHKRIARFDVGLKTGLREVWKVSPGANVCSPVVADGCVYTVQGRLHCIDFETGETKWQAGKYGAPASIVSTGDGRLITWANRGDLVLFEGHERSPNAYTELASKRGVFRKDAWPHVVLANGRLLARDRDGNLACWVLGK